MSAVNEQRFADYVRRLFGLRESSALELIPDVMPVAPVLDATDMLAVAARRERRCAGYAKQAGIPAAFNHQALYNPVASGTIIVVTSVRVNGITSGAQVGMMETFQAQLAVFSSVQGTKGFRDSRLLLSAAPIAEIRTIPAGSGGASIGASSLWSSIGTASGELAVDGGAVILRPGDALVVDSLVANEILRVQYEWTERAATPDDLRSPAA